MWHAKPFRGYDYGSTEWVDNVQEMNKIFNEAGFTLEAQAGMLASFNDESGMNPWAWEGQLVIISDKGLPTNGYGLPQTTGAYRYIYDPDGGGRPSRLEGFSPNWDPTWHNKQAPVQAPTATPEDGIAQCLVMCTDMLDEWCGGGTTKIPWRNNMTDKEYAEVLEYVRQWGQPDGQILFDDYKKITDPQAAAVLWLAGWEIPGNKDGTQYTAYRYERIQTAKQILADGYLTSTGRMPFLFYLKPRRYF